nr:hypothetical protein [Tanacetum cinerariifolium]
MGCYRDDLVYDSNPNSYNQTPDFSYPPSQPQTSSFDQFHCFRCGDPLEDGVRCQKCTCKWCGYGLREGSCWFCASRDGNSSIDVPNPNSFNDLPKVFTHPPQPQYESYLCKLCRNDAHYGYDCPPQYFTDHQKDLNQQRMNDVDDIWNKMIESGNKIIQLLDEESTIPLNEIDSQIPPSIVITTFPPISPIKDPEDSLIMGNEELSTILEKQSDEFVKSSVEDLVPIPSESEDTSGSDSECDLPSCDDFSPINVSEEKSVTFSNSLFYSNDEFTSRDNESLSDEDVLEDNIKIYANPLFKFDDEYISSDVNPLFDKVLENIENKDSYDSNLDDLNLLVTPLSDANEDECFDPGDDVNEIEILLHRDPSTSKMSVASILEGFTN